MAVKLVASTRKPIDNGRAIRKKSMPNSMSLQSCLRSTVQDPSQVGSAQPAKVYVTSSPI
eukprot:2306693-Amphidinium_carterae.1